jgi:hypothetical protein
MLAIVPFEHLFSYFSQSLAYICRPPSRVEDFRE